MSNNDLPIEHILSQIDNQAFYPQHGLQVKKAGAKRWDCVCPFCGDPKHFSLTVTGSKAGLWICSKCNESGNQISFLAKMKGYGNGDAVREIKEMLGLVETQPAKPKHAGKGKGKPKMQTVSPAAPLPGDEDAPPFEAGSQSGGGPPNQPPKSTYSTTQQIYQAIVEAAPLLPAHREQLQKKRGFSDALIDELKFRSCGAHFNELVPRLRQAFTEDDLLDAGALVKVNGQIQINEQLTDDNTLIPYMDESGNVIHLRPHKLGFKGVGIHPYCRYLLREKKPHVVLTEGEFKAAALRQYGLAAVGIPGISSYVKKYLPQLIAALKDFGAKKVTVIYDHEVKDNPAFKGRYKDRPEDRYDTSYYAYLMAYLLNRDGGFQANVGTLSAEWMVEGKIDFDGALAQGRTAKEIQQVIDRALLPKEFLETLGEEGRLVVRKKIARFFAKLNIKREFNRYVATRFRGGKKDEEAVSNFVINIKSSFFTGDEVIRHVEFVNEFGERSGVFTLDPTAMAGITEFKKFCLSKGNYIFEGNGEDLINLWKLEFAEDMGEMINMLQQIGQIKDNFWVFGNMAIKDGKVIIPDTDGIFWIDGRGYKPQSLSVGPKDEPLEDALPTLHEKDIDIADVAQKLKQTVGGYEAYMGIGWVIATIFSRDIFAKHKFIPFIYPHGPRSCGKTTFIGWIMRFFGIESEGYSIAESTQNFIMRILAYFSSLGIPLDEYRNEQRVVSKDGYLRSAYNRQLSGKGVKGSFGARGYRVVGTLAISGEELPKDNGLLTRCIPLSFSAYKRDRTWYEWLNKEQEKFSGFVRHLILNYDNYRDKILQTIAYLKESLLQFQITDRTAGNWAIVAGSFWAVVLQDPEFIKWVEKSCQEIKQTSDQEHMLSIFWDDISILIARNAINSTLIRVEGKRLYCSYKGLYDEWAIHYRKKTGKDPFDPKSILRYMQDEPYFVSNGKETHRIGKGPMKCLVLDLNNATDTLLEIESALLSDQHGTQYQN